MRNPVTKKKVAKKAEKKASATKVKSTLNIQEYASKLTLAEGKKSSILRGDALEILKIINKDLEPSLGKNGLYKAIKKLPK